jgi:hypothetical protein
MNEIQRVIVAEFTSAVMARLAFPAADPAEAKRDRTSIEEMLPNLQEKASPSRRRSPTAPSWRGATRSSTRTSPWAGWRGSCGRSSTAAAVQFNADLR